MTIAQIAQRLAPRNCDACKFYSDQDCRVSRGGAIVARCLSPLSSFSDRYRRGEWGCDWFARGEPIDLPEVERIAG